MQHICQYLSFDLSNKGKLWKSIDSTPFNEKFLILWGDEIFGRHASLSRRWGSRDKRNIEPSSNRRPGSTTELCVIANCPLEVRSLPLQPQKAPITLIINVFRSFFILRLLKLIVAVLLFSD